MLSTGQPATLENYRKMAALVFGEASKAVVFLDKKIQEGAPTDAVLADEGQMVNLLMTLDAG
jgi:hypothetical protein